MAVKIAISVVLLALLFSRIDVDHLWQLARGASVWWLAIAMLIFLVNVLASTWRWRILLKAQHVDVPVRRLLESFLVEGRPNPELLTVARSGLADVHWMARPVSTLPLASRSVAVS